MTLTVPEIGLGCANLLQVTLPEFIAAAEGAGFQRITARPYSFAGALEQGWTEDALRGLLRDADISVTMIDGLSGALPGTPPAADDLDPAVRRRLPPDVLEPPDEDMCFRAATALGAPIVNVTHYMGPALPVEVLAGAVGGVCRRAAALGLQVCLEFIPDTGLPDLPFTQKVVEACGEPNACILLDVFHLDRSGGTVDDIRRLPDGAIGGIQLSDRTPPPPGTPHVPLGGRQLPGEGGLPLRDLVQAALENNPGATVDIEVLNDDLTRLPPRVAAGRLAAAAGAWRATLE